MMRKVIAIGETILDIIFHNQQPTAAVPGGSSFNSIISVGRSGIPAVFIGETGNDDVGRQISAFLNRNHVNPQYLKMRDDVKSAVSLAYLDENNDAHYTFYKETPRPDPSFSHPEINAEDIIQFGSYYAICPNIRTQVKGFLEHAHGKGAILYYDLNFRKSHRHELEQLLPSIHDNFRISDIVRGSADDFEIMYGERNASEIYRKHIAPYCSIFICTDGGNGITVCTPNGEFRYPVINVETVSNIGAGDNFNAGFIYGIVKYGIRHDDLQNLDTEKWEKLVDCGRRFAANVCASVHNSISEDFGNEMKAGLNL